MKMMLQYWKLNFLSLMEYKLSFLMEVWAMLMNDALFMSMWYMFFMKFGTMWGMQFWDFALLMSMMVMVFAMVHMFFANYYNMWTMMEEWKLDSHLLLPKNLLVSLLSGKMMTWAFWDLIFSFILMFFMTNISLLIVFKMIMLSMLWSITFLWFLLMFASLSFFTGSSKNLMKGVFEAILWPSHYPPAMFEGTILKYLFMTIMPVFYVMFLPYKLAVSFDMAWFIQLVLWSLFFLSLWVFIFYKWLKSYESWNMLNTNM